MESDPTRMCELLVGLPEVNVLSIDDVAGDPLRVHIEGRSKRPGCARLRSVRPREGPAGGRAGGSALLRAAHPSDLAQAPVAVSGVVLFDRRRGSARSSASVHPAWP